MRCSSSTLTPSGARFVYASYLGGAADDRAVGVALSPSTTHIVGNTRSTDFPKVTPIINGLVGAQDAFVVKLPSIDAVSAPALPVPWLALMACLLCAVAWGLLKARRPAHCRSER